MAVRDAGVAAAAEITSITPVVTIGAAAITAVLARVAVVPALVLAVAGIAVALFLLAALFSLAGLILPFVCKRRHGSDRASQRQKNDGDFVHRAPEVNATSYLPTDSGKFPNP